MKVPVIGESITEVTLSQWLKGNGEYVELDEPLGDRVVIDALTGEVAPFAD